MDLSKRADELLSRTESDLRKLLSEAAAAGDYASVVYVAGLARSLTQIIKQPTPATSLHKPATTQTVGTKQAKSRNRSRQNKSAYPRFARTRDRLVRVAWSKREKKEYEQRAPLSILAALTAEMLAKGSVGRVFTTDELLPVNDQDGAEVPTYQVYAWIALLKQVGLIEQHGRQGYSIPRPSDFKGSVEAVWRTLPEK